MTQKLLVTQFYLLTIYFTVTEKKLFITALFTITQISMGSF